MRWPDERLRGLLKTEHPIIQSPMAGPATAALAIAVSEAGGVGSLGSAEMTPDDVRAAVLAVRAGTDRTFNLNFFVNPAPTFDPEVWERTRRRLAPWYARVGLEVPRGGPGPLAPGFDDDRLQLVLDLRPPVVSFHFGVPAPDALEALRGAGTVVLSTATTTAEARALELAGVDAVIAQGWEAGGHRGSHAPRPPADGIGALALVPQVVDAVTIPVIAAGGIADGRGVAAALALGAGGVQIGTAFLRCPEAATDARRRELLATARDTDTLMTDSGSGRAARAVRSAYSTDMETIRHPLPEFPSLYALTDPLFEHAPTDVASFHLYGQAASLAREVTAGQLLASLVADAGRVLDRLGGITGAD